MRAQNISGMGIGLYLTREVIAQHGGEVSVESVEGEGSTFTVRLPLADQTRHRHSKPVEGLQVEG